MMVINMVRAAVAMVLATGVPGAATQVCDSVWHDAARGRDLPVRIRLPDSGGRFPVVLFSHGLGGSVAAGTRWANDWVTAGIAVVHLQHPGSDRAVWASVSPPDRIAALKAAATAPQLIARVGDVRFAVDRITAGGNSGGCDLGRLDPGRIGLAGHSFGAATVQAVAGQRYAAAGGRSIGDPRIIGFIALSPSAPKDGGDPGFAFAQVTRPFLSVTGSRDASPLDPGLTPASRQAVFAGLPPGNAYLLVAGDADHAILSGSDEGRAMHSTGTDDAGVDRVVEQVTTLFWRATLLGDAAAARRLKALPPAMLPVGFTYTAK